MNRTEWTAGDVQLRYSIGRKNQLRIPRQSGWRVLHSSAADEMILLAAAHLQTSQSVVTVRSSPFIGPMNETASKLNE